MGDFERTFGAGADPDMFLRNSPRRGVQQIQAARVRFSPDGRAHLVNCSFAVKADDFVVVRIKGHFTELHVAQISEARILSQGSCKHTVVCRQEDQESYGSGPDFVQSAERLDIFLQGAMKWRRYPVLDRWGKFHTAYVAGHPPYDNSSVHAFSIIALGEDLVSCGRPGIHPEDGMSLRLESGKITNIPLLGPLLGPDRYARAADYAERDLIEEA